MDVHGPLLNWWVMNVVKTALAARPGQKPVGVPQRPDACLFLPRAQSLKQAGLSGLLCASVPPWCQSGKFALQCYSLELRIFGKISSTPFPLFAPVQIFWLRLCRAAPLRLCVKSGQPFLPRAPRLRPLSPFKIYSCHSSDSWATLPEIYPG